MRKLILDIEKVEANMRKFGKERPWIEGELELTRQAIAHYWKFKPVRAAEKLAPLFNLDPVDLVTSIDTEELEQDAG